MANSAVKKAVQSNKTLILRANISLLVVVAFHLVFRYLIRDRATISRWMIVRSVAFITALALVNRYLARVARPRADANGRITCISLSDPSLSLAWDTYYIISIVLILSPASERVYWLSIFIPVIIAYQIYTSIIKPMRGIKANQPPAEQ